VRIAIVVLLLLILAGVLWGASSLNYRTCVDAAKAAGAAAEGGNRFKYAGEGSDYELDRINGCSHLPW
jgi:Na+-transporting methylmalonyl-CoA/oxaloacetate decarboxylase gamma subunit